MFLKDANNFTVNKASTLTTARTINGTSFSGSANITTANWGTARTLTVGNASKSVNGSANISWSLSEIGAAPASHSHNYAPVANGVQRWNAVVKCATWSRIMYLSGNTTVGHSGIINIQGTRSGVVFNATFIINTSHHSKAYITQINNTNYSNFQIRAIANANGETYIEIYDNANGATNATTQTLNISYTAISGIGAGTLTKYTTFTDGTTLPTNFTEVHKITTVSGSHYSGNAATATTLQTARTINGTSFNGSGNITTANWGTARNIYIADNSSTNTGPAVSVNGSGNATLKLPATIKATLTGNASTATTLQTTRTINGTSFNGSADITTANWGTARTITIGATGKSVNGSGNYSWSASEILAGQTVGYGNFGGLFIERTGSTNGASIGFKNSNGTLGYIGMNAVNGGLMRWSADTNSQYTVLDTGNYKTHITPANIGAAISSHTHYYAGSSSVGGAANSAVKATQDSAGQQINTTYIKGLSVSGKTITYTKGDGTTGTITTQDTNTTYSTGTASALGLTKLYTSTGTATDGTMTQSAINTALNGKANSSHTHNSITNQDTRDVDTTPTQMPLGLSVHLKSNGTDGLDDGGGYHSTLMIKGWNDVSGGPWAQMTVTANNNLYFRSSNNDTWNAWKKVSLDGHTHSYLPLSGGTVSGSINPPSDIYGSLGKSSLRWAEIHALTITANTFKGNATSAAKLSSARTINGTNFDGTGNITTANWGTARTITVGSTSKSVNGSANVSWTLSEIGAAPALALANGYYGMVTNDGNSSNWIRTTQSGIIPHHSGGASSVGTSSWPFSTIYASNFYGTLNGNATHWGGRQVWWGAAGSRPGNGYIQFVW